VEIRSIAFTAVSDDECALLSWMAALQRNESPQRSAAHPPHAMRHAKSLAADFAAAGLRFAGSLAQPIERAGGTAA
jgi:hypothetical protein